VIVPQAVAREILTGGAHNIGRGGGIGG